MGKIIAAAVDEYAWLDATAQAELVRRRQVKPTELVEAALSRIDRLNPALNAVVTPIDPRPALNGGPFAGVPFVVKDLLLELAGTRYTAGSRWLADHVSTHDQELALRYRRAGLVIVSKTNTCEFGLSPTCEPALFGPTRNPWDLDRSTGGSSGGSAAAVAAGLAPMAHANDLGGSIRIPAAWCGLFGFKPGRGRSPVDRGYGELVSRYATEHVLTRSVRDSAALLDAVTGCHFAAGVGADPGRLRIAVSTRPRNGHRVDPAWSAAATRAASLLEQLGHTVEEATPDALHDPEYGRSLRIVYRAAARSLVENCRRRLGRPPREAEIEPQTWAYWNQARGISASDCQLAAGALDRITRRVADWFASYDAWLTPTLGGPPPPLGELVGTPDDPLRGSHQAGNYLMFDLELANVTGNPAMSVPFGADPAGLPVGIHLLGRYAGEATLFRLAAQLEAAAPWRRRTPEVAA